MNQKEKKIATINLGGNNLLNCHINHMPLQLEIQWCEKIVEGITSILAAKEYDIICIQEFPCQTTLLSSIGNGTIENTINEIIGKKGYEIKLPSKLHGNTRFTVGFIFRKEILGKEITGVSDDLFGEDCKRNKCMQMNFTLDGRNINILNLHIDTPMHKKLSGDNYKRIKSYLDQVDSPDIILGDFNAHTDKQIAAANGKGSKYVQLITTLEDKNYVELESNVYTYLSSEWKKLDHVFVNKGKYNIAEETVVENVNCDSNKEDNGFTDHSMLVATIEF